MKMGQFSERSKQRQYSVSSLEKVFPRREPVLLQDSYTIFRNETFHFQVVCFGLVLCEYCRVEIDSPIKEYISVRKVESVPAAYAENIYKTDDYILNKDPNGQTYPDVLVPLDPAGETMRQNSWTAFWITVDGEKGLPEGEHNIAVRVFSEISGYDKTSLFMLRVLGETLPSPDIVHTMWIHYDCICDKHGVEPFSDRFYSVFGKYLESAVKHGMNMLYTPLFTPALDTEKGTYRRTVQLVNITAEEDRYGFDFTEFGRFAEFAFGRGIKYLELSHLATQWGGERCPKVVAVVNGEKKRIFGWEDESMDKRYIGFLRAFLSAFGDFVRAKGLEEKIYFHISDEPDKNALGRFAEIRRVINEFFPQAKLMDAVCEKEFITRGIIDYPIVGTDRFAESPCGWIYYCCEQTHSYLSNRLLNMPLQRTRILGMQMYRNGVNGFLHWAFNFYLSAGSRKKIDPYYITDACGYLPGGDSFIVYPAEDGVYESIRHEVLEDAFQDYSALKLLESYIGKEQVFALLEKEGVKRGFTEYNRSAKWHNAFRLKLNKMIMDQKRRAEKKR